MATPISWPSFVPTPIRATFTPMDEAVGAENPTTGARNVYLRWNKWRAKLDWNAMASRDALAIKGHFSRHRGGTNTFQIPACDYRVARGNKSGTVTLNGAHVARAESIAITGGSGAFATGDHLMLTKSSVPRLHVCTAAESGGSVGIYPWLQDSYATGTTVTLITSSTFLYDTMELPPDFEFPTFEVAKNPKYALPFALEFTTAFRASF